MKNNVGKTDRVVRMVFALGVAGTAAVGWLSGSLLVGLGVLAAIFAVTSLVGYCPLYHVVGLSTCPAENSRA